eukprot:s618_g20.t1
MTSALVSLPPRRCQYGSSWALKLQSPSELLCFGLEKGRREICSLFSSFGTGKRGCSWTLQNALCWLREEKNWVAEAEEVPGRLRAEEAQISGCSEKSELREEVRQRRGLDFKLAPLMGTESQSEGDSGDSLQLELRDQQLTTRQYGGFFPWVGASYRLQVHHGAKPLQWLNRLTQRSQTFLSQYARDAGFLTLPEAPLSADEALSKHYLDFREETAAKQSCWSRPQDANSAPSNELIQKTLQPCERLPRPLPPGLGGSRLRRSLQAFARRPRRRTPLQLLNHVGLAGLEDSEGEATSLERGHTHILQRFVASQLEVHCP